MDWLNLHIQSTIRSPAYIGSSPEERGTWLSVIAYACEIECGGRIPLAATWKDRQWQQSCGVTLREVKAADRLLAVDGDDVMVNGYPTEKEKQVRQARGAGTAGAMARWGKVNADRHGVEHGALMATGIAVANAEGEGEGKEKGRRREAASPRDELQGVEEPNSGTPISDRELVRPLAAWVCWRNRKDPDAEADNLAELVALIREHGAQAIELAAKTGHISTAQKLWPNQIPEWLPHADLAPEPVNTVIGFTMEQMTKAYPVIADAVKLIEQHGWEWARDLWRYTPAQMPDHAAALKVLRTDITASEELVRKAASGK